MKNYMYKILFFLFQAHFLFAQNMVPNNSFENFTQCPNDQAQINFATGWVSFGNTPDYFNSCATDTSWAFHWSVPINWSGSQPAAEGNAYVGIFTKQLPTNNVREYIGVKLSDTLQMGKRYVVSFKLSMGFGGLLDINCASNNIGVLFSTAPFYYSESTSFIKNFAHIYSGNINSDTANWITVSGTIISDSAYQYIVIGNFFDDNTTSSIKFYDNGYSECAAYYYIDDVWVLEEDTINSNNSKELEKKITIYPNPVGCIVNIEVEDVYFYNAHIGIYDLFGIMKHETSLLNNKVSIPLCQYPSGVYILDISTQNVHLYKKLIINKN